MSGMMGDISLWELFTVRYWMMRRPCDQLEISPAAWMKGTKYCTRAKRVSFMGEPQVLRLFTYSDTTPNTHLSRGAPFLNLTKGLPLSPVKR